MLRHIPLPEYYSGKTMTMKTWLSDVLAKSSFRGDEMTEAFGHFRNPKDFIGPLIWLCNMTPRKMCGIRFKDFVAACGRGLKVDGHSEGVYLAKPDEVVDMAVEFETSWAAGQVIIPMGDFDYSDSMTKAVLMQCSRQWFGYGNLTATDETVLNMYYSAIQSLVVAFSKSETLEDQERLAYPLLALVRGLASLNKKLPIAKTLLDKMIVFPCVDEMLQKALGHVFAQKLPTQEDQVLMLENIVRRNHRLGEPISLANYSMFAVFLAAPLLYYYLSSEEPLTSSDALEYLTVFNDYINTYADNILAEGNNDEERAIAALADTAFEKPLTNAQVTGFFSSLKANPSSSVPWVALGVLPLPPGLVANLFTGPFAANGKPSATLPAVVKSTGAYDFTVAGQKGTEWTGIQFLSSGVYTINMKLGSEQTAVGLDLKANLRLTLGSDIMKSTERSYSLAGMHHKFDAVKGWKLVVDRPLDSSKPILVLVSNGYVYLQQDGLTFATFPRYEQPVLVAFKNALLNVSYSDAQIHSYVTSAEPTKKPSAFAKLSAKVGAM